MKLDQTKAFTPASTPESKLPGFADRVSKWSTQNPILAVLLVSLMAVVINCYPIIFCGRSYVSPACAGPLVYGWRPPLPGMQNSIAPVQSHGSDTWATMLWGVPVGFIESRSLLENGEVPLWNRYGHAGDTLIGQAISMLGDPLQWIVILGRGSAGAWDIKYVVAKFLFCVGFGLLILRLFGNRPPPWIYAALAAYCGAFFYINNHPVFFVFCYAPWILLSALAWLDLQSGKHVGWGMVWLLANFACLNAGHVEVAVVLIGGLNLTAVAHALARQRKAADWARVIGRMSAGTILFLGLTAPMWISFLATLDGAYTAHSEVHVGQIPVVAFPGVFDDIFFLLPRVNMSLYAATAPGTSLLVMVGTILAVLRWRQLKGETFFWVNGGAIILWGGCVFGWVPAAALAAIPLLNRVGHVYTDFSYLLVIHLTIQSAFGFKCLAEEKDFRRAGADLIWVALIFGGLILVYCFGITHNPIPWDYVLCAVAGGFGAPLLFMFLKNHHRQTSAAGWTGIIILGFIPHFRFGLYTIGSDNLLMLPGPRSVLDAPSKAIDKIRADESGPFRVVGLGWNFAGDYSAVYGIEDIRSCAPLSNGEFIKVVREIPGMSFSQDWVLQVLDPVAAQPLLNLLDVKYLLTQPDPKAQIRAGLDFRITDRSDFLVLENLQAWPRAFFSDKVSTNSSTKEFLQQLSESSKQPFVSLSEDEIRKRPGLQALESTNKATIVPATHYRLLANSTAFDIHAPSAGVVFLAEGQARDFTATANNEPKEVLTVNRAFKGVYLGKPGDYHVEFIYRPRHWRLACALFWISIGGVIMLALMAYASSGCRSRLAFDTDPAKN